jgi:ABC-2 type transport system ATP-binding protein
VSIEVKNVVKYYKEQAALNDVSFKINSGEIVGFLGPNGAGKSTMMKIITCFIPKSSGLVKVCGLDVDDNSIEVRRKEYLGFVGGIYGIKNKNERVKEMVNLVGLEKEQHKKIGALSKGYRQRVGLAQAIIHEPEVLILDEPTSGLDPNQLVDIRQLILNIGKTKTVMLSTHIMQEVEAICDRVIIIKEGQIVADDTAKHIQQKDELKQTVLVEFDKEASRNQLKQITNVKSVKNVEGNKWIFMGEGDIRPHLAKFAQQNNFLILAMSTVEKSMEDVFKEMTGN